mgnify:CR=1 FL=1
MKWVFPFTRGVTPRYYLPTRGLSVCPIRPILQPRHQFDRCIPFLYCPFFGAMSRYPLPLLGLVIDGGIHPPPQVVLMVGVFPQGFSSLPSFSDNS